MEQLFKKVFIDYRGRHRKGIAIYDAIEDNFYNKKFVFTEQKCIFGHCKKGSNLKNIKK